MQILLLKGLENMVVYKLTYSDNHVVIKTFPNDYEANWFCHNEGDHLLNWEKQY